MQPLEPVKMVEGVRGFPLKHGDRFWVVWGCMRWGGGDVGITVTLQVDRGAKQLQ